MQNRSAPAAKYFKKAVALEETRATFHVSTAGSEVTGLEVNALGARAKTRNSPKGISAVSGATQPILIYALP